MATLGEIALTKLPWKQQNKIRLARMSTESLAQRLRRDCGHEDCDFRRGNDDLCLVRELARRVLEGEL